MTMTKHPILPPDLPDFTMQTGNSGTDGNLTAGGTKSVASSKTVWTDIITILSMIIMLFGSRLGITSEDIQSLVNTSTAGVTFVAGIMGIVFRVKARQALRVAKPIS
jgi:hypothetical protein